MELEYVSNPALLSQIKRSHGQLWKRMRTEKVVTTNLFVFEYVDCSEVEIKYRYLWNFCLKVTVVATGKKFAVTQIFSFGDDWWTLYRVKEVKQDVEKRGNE